MGDKLSQENSARVTSALRGLGPDLASAADERGVVFARVTAPFLPAGYLVVRVQRPGRPRARVVHLAIAPGGEATVLTGDPVAFNRLARDAGVRVEDPSTALAVARVFVEATTPGDRRYQPVGSPSDLPWRRPLTEEEEDRRAAVLRRVGGDMAPVAEPGEEGGYDIGFYVVRDRNLDHATLTISPAGEVAVAHHTIEADLPFHDTPPRV